MKIDFRALKEEREYVFQERLGIICEGRDPTAEEIAIASAEADRRMAELAQKKRPTELPR